ncbi:hypothetical protein, partial [Sediminibacterium sp.]|uniref:hypothetical protein n=1 Tax=Sediminibacterium sp. TaxID=1917865 RepID=UPI003F6A4DAB
MASSGKKINWLGIDFTNTGDYSFEEALFYNIERKMPSYVCYLNAQSVSLFHEDKNFRQAIQNSSFNFPDGMPIVASFNFVKKPK